MARYSYLHDVRRHVGNRPLVVAGTATAVLDDVGRLLMQQRAEGGNEWGLPGGVLETGETIEECALRETLEETGWTVSPIELLGVYSGRTPHVYPNGDVVFSVLAVLLCNPCALTSAPDPGETRTAVWFPLDELPTRQFLPHRPAVQDLVSGRRAAWI